MAFREREHGPTKARPAPADLPGTRVFKLNQYISDLESWSTRVEQLKGRLARLEREIERVDDEKDSDLKEQKLLLMKEKLIALRAMLEADTPPARPAGMPANGSFKASGPQLVANALTEAFATIQDRLAWLDLELAASARKRAWKSQGALGERRRKIDEACRTHGLKPPPGDDD
jgi:hypothetical protein